MALAKPAKGPWKFVILSSIIEASLVTSFVFGGEVII
jgi:hypothetical protein